MQTGLRTNDHSDVRPIFKSVIFNPNPNKMKIQIQKTNPEFTLWALRIGVVILYVVFYVFKKKLYL